MIEAFVVFMLVGIGGGAYLYALFLSTPLTAKDVAELKQCQAELSERIEKGRAQKWDEVMLCHMRQQLAEIDARIAKTDAA